MPHSSYSSQANKTQRMEISKIHTPPGFTLESLNRKKINDAALIELKKDVQLSAKVMTLQCVSFQVLPICLPSATGNDYQEQV